MRDFPPLLTAAEMRAADAAATRDLGLPSLLLMENAGRGVAEILLREMGGGRGALDAASGWVAIVCGGGANGGDGFVAARHLHRAGVSVRVLLTAPRAASRGDAALNLVALERMGGVEIDDAGDWTDEARWRARLSGAVAVVDAIFGIGVRGAVAGVPAAALAAMNEIRAFKLAVDLPTGLDADSGRAAGPVFSADVTATMGARKLGLAVESASPAGRVEVVELGAPIALEGAVGARLLDEPGVIERLPRRAAAAHKGSSGHLLVVAGSPGKTGAAVLVGQAGLRAGAGLVTLASTPEGQSALDAKVVELMTARFTGGTDADPSAGAELEALARRAQAVAIGPGIPTGPGMAEVVRQLAGGLALPMVLDADALNALATEAAAVLAGAPAARVLTPHPGEMGRLLGIPIAEVQADRLGHAARLASASRAVVVLKGAHTVVASPDGTAFVSPIACPALATAGSGDVLCGVIGALLARGLDALSAAQVGVFVHGLAGEALAARLGDGVIAGDLPATVAGVMARLAGAATQGHARTAAFGGGRGSAPRRTDRFSPRPRPRQPR